MKSIDHIDLPYSNGMYHLGELHEIFGCGKQIQFSEVVDLLSRTTSILQTEDNLLRISTENVLIIGDVHGEYYTFKEFLKRFNSERDHLIMLGDYVDRGSMSIEIIITLCCLKCNYPDQIHLLRGNHETKLTTQKYGFRNECLEKYNKFVYSSCLKLFRYLPVAAVLTTNEYSYFLCHGGIATTLKKVEMINEFDRNIEPKKDTLLYELLWNDPYANNVEGSELNFGMVIRHNRQIRGYNFGGNALESFLSDNDLSLVIRGHQCVPRGYELYDYGKVMVMCITVFSVPQYQSKKSNIGSVLSIQESNFEFKSLTEKVVRPTMVSIKQVFHECFETIINSFEEVIQTLLLCHDEKDESVKSFENEARPINEKKFTRNALSFESIEYKKSDASLSAKSMSFCDHYRSSQDELSELNNGFGDNLPITTQELILEWRNMQKQVDDLFKQKNKTEE